MLADMLAKIGPALREGRLEEAADLARAAERLTRVAEAAERILPPTPQEEADARKAADARRAAEQARWERSVYERAERLADAMLSDEGHGVGACWSHAALHWRARVLGPKVAQADFGRTVHGGWADRHYDGDGALKPLPDAAMPDDFGVRQFLVQTGQAADKASADPNRFQWPPACAGWTREGPAPTASQDETPEPLTPARPLAGEPQAGPAEPPAPTAPVKPKLSFEERVRLASGKSGPESRPRGWG